MSSPDSASDSAPDSLSDSASKSLSAPSQSVVVGIEPHPLLDAGAFVTVFGNPAAPTSLSELTTPAEWLLLLQAGTPEAAAAPLKSDDHVRAKVRDLLRHAGFKPTGRSKPASEYLIRASEEGMLGRINFCVDACNVVSLHSGLPISVVDLDRAQAPLSLQVAPEGSKYLFNASGQEIDVGQLLCLCDAEGPCANSVKDSQRTKTHPGTTRTLSIVWGTHSLPGRTAQTVAWYRRLLEAAGAATFDVTFSVLKG